MGKIFFSHETDRGSKGFAKNKHITRVNSKGQYEDFDMRNIFIFLQIKLIFTWKVLYLA